MVIIFYVDSAEPSNISPGHRHKKSKFVIFALISIRILHIIFFTYNAFNNIEKW